MNKTIKRSSEDSVQLFPKIYFCGCICVQDSDNLFQPIKFLRWQVTPNFIRGAFYNNSCKNYQSVKGEWKRREWSSVGLESPAGIYVIKVNDENTRTIFQTSSEFTMKTPERHQWCRFIVFIINFEKISHIVLVFTLLTLNK